MTESPIFVKTDDFLLWLLRSTEKFPKAQRFKMARWLEDNAMAFQESIVWAARSKEPRHLSDADVQLMLLKRRIRLARELELLTFKQYKYASSLLVEIGKLLEGLSIVAMGRISGIIGRPSESSG